MSAKNCVKFYQYVVTPISLSLHGSFVKFIKMNAKNCIKFYQYVASEAHNSMSPCDSCFEIH
jgi:hypothetical protein